MNLDKEKKLINQLIEKSRKSEIHWNFNIGFLGPTYYVNLDSGMIELIMDEGANVDSRAVLTISNEKGEKISDNEFFKTTDLEEYENLLVLEALAERYVKGTDKTLDACLGELDNEGLIGKR